MRWWIAASVLWMSPVLPQAAWGSLTTSHLTDEAAAAIVEVNGGAFRFTTESRIGRIGDWELGMRRHPSIPADETLVTADFDVWPNGLPVLFSLTYDGQGRVTQTLTFLLTNATVTNNAAHNVAGDFNELFIRTRAANANTSIVVSGLILDGVPVVDTSTSIHLGADARDVLRIQGGSLSDGFTLTGTITMAWVGAKPTGSQLDAQVWGAKVVAQPTDTEAPSIAIVSPSGPVVYARPDLQALVEYRDDGSGIDPGSFRLLLDGNDRTAGCTVDASQALCPLADLGAGPHTLRASVADQAGNSREAGVSFEAQLDNSPPALSLEAPASTVLSDRTPTLLIRYSDAGAGIAPESLEVRMGEVDLAPGCLIQPEEAECASEALSPGTHPLAIRISDRAGNVSTLGMDLIVPADPDPPQVAWVSPRTPARADLPHLARADYSDLGSGIDRASIQVTLDGADITSSCLIGDASLACRLGVLAPGAHLLRVSLSDHGGNPASAERSFAVIGDNAPPAIAVAAPRDGGYAAASPLSVSGTVSDDDAVAAVTVNGTAAALSGNAFSAPVVLARGRNTLTVVATDRVGRQSEVSLSVTLDDAPPLLAVESPRSGTSTNSSSIAVTGTVGDDHGVASLTVGGLPATLVDGRFTAAVTLQEGANAVPVTVADLAGNTRTEQVAVTLFSLPSVAITSPEDLSFLAATAVDVSGTVSGSGTRVTVNGVAAVVSGNSFTAEDVPLIEGGNILTAVAESPNGRKGTYTINVVRDLTAPRLAVHHPRDGSAVDESPVAVSGMVNDIVAGTVNASEVAVTVNGRPATVSNRSFLATGVPLSPGENTLAVVATDESGNVGEATVTVRLEAAGARRIAIVSGDGQAGAIGTQLPAPLEVVLLDAAGQPVVGVPVVFKVAGNDGSLDGGRRRIAVTTGPSGRAAAHFTLGLRTGAGSQVVEASAVGFQGPAVFRATALPGPPALIVVDAGDQQFGVAGRALPRPLVATVTDPGFNRLGGVPVRFRAVKGQGHFENGQQEVVVASDSDGRAVATFVLDPAEGTGNNVVEAVIDGFAESPLASFVASGWAAGDPAATSVSGVVLDNTNAPVAGVTLRILDTPLTAQTDAQGLFRISGAPVGTVKLVVDGSTASRPGNWPDLEFVLATVPGRDNTVNMPIYLLPLDLQHGVQVDETRGGTITLPEIPGFSLEIAPGSVTFPGGSRSGVVSATAVHGDKVPMVPNFGQQPRLIVTIQPAGARFDPPARLILPNLEGLPPGHVTELYSFDHDLGHFVSIGPATVSDDGRSIVSNPGVGIVKAGWHCGGDPAASGTTHDCPECYRCVNNRCERLPKEIEEQTSCKDDGNACTKDICSGGRCVHPPKCEECSMCEGGTCKVDPVLDKKPCTDDGEECTKDICKSGKCEHLQKKVDELEIRLTNSSRNAIRGDQQPAGFNTSKLKTSNCEWDQLKYEWDFGDPDSGAENTSTAAPPVEHTYPETGKYTVKLKVQCGNCKDSAKEASQEVTIGFLATCYMVADENDYGAPFLDNPHGLTGRYSEPFLRAVRMQGSGRSRGGQLIQIDFGRGNFRGGFATTYFHVVPQILTRSGQPLRATTIAVDPSIIPLGSTVNVETLGARTADDTGGRITGYHIDVFGGYGRQACAGWANPILPIEGY